jgi:hypothetical protein
MTDYVICLILHGKKGGFRAMILIFCTKQQYKSESPDCIFMVCGTVTSRVNLKSRLRKSGFFLTDMILNMTDYEKTIIKLAIPENWRKLLYISEPSERIFNCIRGEVWRSVKRRLRNHPLP